MVYVIVILSAVTCLFTSLLSLIGQRSSYISNYTDSLLSVNEDIEVREFIMADFSDYIKENETEVREKGFYKFCETDKMINEYKWKTAHMKYENKEEKLAIYFKGRVIEVYPVITDEKIIYRFR